MKTNSAFLKIEKMCVAGLLAALSFVLMLVLRFPLFTAFYELEFSDFPLLVCACAVGPAYSICALLAVCFIQTLTVSTSSGIIGFVMHFVSSAAMILIVYFVKTKLGGIKGIIVSAICGVAVMTAIMIPMNFWLTTKFMALPIEEFIKGYLVVCVAFNVIKSLSNIILFNVTVHGISKQFDKVFIKR